jgi:ketosteroid isomerase-like protein
MRFVDPPATTGLKIRRVNQPGSIYGAASGASAFGSSLPATARPTGTADLGSGGQTLVYGRAPVAAHQEGAAVTDQQSVRDELDIQRVIYEYAWACDNGDWKLLKSIFTDDASLDYSTTEGPAGSRDEVVAWLEESLSQLTFIYHVVSNFQIDLDGDRAGVRAMFHCTARFPGVDENLVTGGYYDEELVRTPDGWKIRRLFEDNRYMQRPAGFGA